MENVILKKENSLSYQKKAPAAHHEKVKDWPEFSVDFVGVCHSDKTFLKNPSTLPVVMGHEIVCHAKANNKIQYYTICNEIPCKKCQYCLDENFSHCQNLIELGVNEQSGYAKSIKAPRTSLIPIDFKDPKLGVLIAGIRTVVNIQGKNLH